MRKLLLGGAVVVLIGVVMVIVLRESPQSEQKLTLTDGAWRWVSAEDASKKIEPQKADAFVLSFTTEGRVSSSTDCNQVVGSYTTDGQSLTFGPLATTMMYCEGSQETEYTTLLAKTTGYAITGDALTLQLSDGGTMHFTNQSENY